MNSLALLSAYSSSEEDEENENKNECKRLPVPKLPSYQVPTAISREPVEDKSKHQHRKRTFGHEPGNWATFVFIPVKYVEDCLEYAMELQKVLCQFDLHPVDDFHISVTRTVVLKHHWISDFMKSVRFALYDKRSFLIKLSGLKAYVNDDHTRTFVSLTVHEGNDYIKDIVCSLDKCLIEYGLPVYYKDPSFHFSLLWCVGDHESDISLALSKLSEILQTFIFVLNVDDCFCTCGNKSFHFPFMQGQGPETYNKNL